MNKAKKYLLRYLLCIRKNCPVDVYEIVSLPNKKKANK